jgi:hypothetical protein
VFICDRHGGAASSVKALTDINTGMEMLEISHKVY